VPDDDLFRPEEEEDQDQDQDLEVEEEESGSGGMWIPEVRGSGVLQMTRRYPAVIKQLPS